MEIHIGPGHHHGHHDHHRHHHRHHRGHSVTVTHSVSSKGGTIAFGLIFLIISLAVAGVFYYINNVKGGKYVQTTGVIVDIHERYDYDSGYMYSSIAEYVVDGETYTVQDTASSSTPDIVGREVIIEYMPQSPKTARFKATIGTNLIVYGVCGVLALAGLIVFIKGIKMQKPERLSEESSDLGDNSF